VAVVQYTFTHKQYTEYTEQNAHKNKNKKKFGKCRPCPIFTSYTLAFALHLRKKHGKTSVRVLEEKHQLGYVSLIGFMEKNSDDDNDDVHKQTNENISSSYALTPVL
jgi:hypothetical protein